MPKGKGTYGYKVGRPAKKKKKNKKKWILKNITLNYLCLSSVF